MLLLEDTDTKSQSVPPGYLVFSRSRFDQEFLVIPLVFKVS